MSRMSLTMPFPLCRASWQTPATDRQFHIDPNTLKIYSHPRLPGPLVGAKIPSGKRAPFAWVEILLGIAPSKVVDRPQGRGERWRGEERVGGRGGWLGGGGRGHQQEVEVKGGDGGGGG